MKHTEYLKYTFSEDELREHGRALARNNKERASLEQQKKEIDASLKAQIEERVTAVAKLSDFISNGFEYRLIECAWQMDDPDVGRKTMYRTDTGELVRVDRMTDEDRQQVLDLQGAEA